MSKVACKHDWWWECAPIGPDWRWCRLCKMVEIECEGSNGRACTGTMPENACKCPVCGKRRAHNKIRYVVVS